MALVEGDLWRGDIDAAQHAILCECGSRESRRYRVTRHIHSGARGHVFEAYDDALKVCVALKFVHVQKDPRELEAARREAMAMIAVANKDPSSGSRLFARFQRALGSWLADASRVEYAIMSMELCDSNMHAYTRKLHADAQAMATRHGNALMYACSVGKRLLGAAHVMHDKCGRMHRDISMANVLIKFPKDPDPKDPDQDFLVADFGACCDIAQPAGAIASTRWYRAPELWDSKRGLRCDAAHGPAVDVYSIGCIIAEAALGRELFKCSANAASYARAYVKCIGRWRPRVSDVEALARGNKLDSGLCQELIHALQSMPPEADRATSGLDRIAVDWPGLASILATMLSLDPDARPTARACLQHPIFR